MVVPLYLKCAILETSSAVSPACVPCVVQTHSYHHGPSSKCNPSLTPSTNLLRDITGRYLYAWAFSTCDATNRVSPHLGLIDGSMSV